MKRIIAIAAAALVAAASMVSSAKVPMPAPFVMKMTDGSGRLQVNTPVTTTMAITKVSVTRTEDGGYIYTPTEEVMSQYAFNATTNSEGVLVLNWEYAEHVYGITLDDFDWNDVGYVKLGFDINNTGTIRCVGVLSKSTVWPQVSEYAMEAFHAAEAGVSQSAQAFGDMHLSNVEVKVVTNGLVSAQALVAATECPAQASATTLQLPGYSPCYMSIAMSDADWAKIDKSVKITVTLNGENVFASYYRPIGLYNDKYYNPDTKSYETDTNEMYSSLPEPKVRFTNFLVGPFANEDVNKVEVTFSQIIN